MLKSNRAEKEQGARERHAMGEGVAVREAHENRFFPSSESVENFLVKRLWGVRIRVEEKLSIKKS